MTRITNVDQVLILLRSHLHKSERARSTRKPAAKTTEQKSAVERVGQIAADGQASDEDIRRVLITGILVEEFGSGIITDTRFDGLVVRVLDALKQDADGNALIEKSLAKLSGSQ